MSTAVEGPSTPDSGEQLGAEHDLETDGCDGADARLEIRGDVAMGNLRVERG